MTTTLPAGKLQAGKLVSLRGREWIVLPADDPDLLVLKPLGGSEDEITGLYRPLLTEHDTPVDAVFAEPTTSDIGDIATARLLWDSARLAFRNGAGPFRALARLSFRPRSYQMVPLIMALRLPTVRMLIADDVGVGKTIEALLIVREMLERRAIKRFAVVCLPHLCEQWQSEIRDKLDLEAVIIRSSTQAALDRRIQGDTSVFEFYPYQVISIDYIKSDVRSNVFVEQCPELVIVDEAHTCAKPAGASAGQQQRYHLISRLARSPQQQLLLLTATPHSGKLEEFQSLLGLLKPEFAQLDLPQSSQKQRRELAQHFIQRKRADVARWMNEDTPFPNRESIEWPYDLSKNYARFFNDLLDFLRKLVSEDPGTGRQQRVRYWTALALLRGVMSSPAAGIEMLNSRLENLAGDDALEAERPEPNAAHSTFEAERREPPGCDLSFTTESTENTEEVATALASDLNPLREADYGTDSDVTPTTLVEHQSWSQSQKKRLRDFASQLSKLTSLREDQKLAAAEAILDDWLNTGFHPVVFCRFIATANAVGEALGPVLKKKFPKLEVQIITSELPDDVRRDRIDDMSRSPLRLLIATDCLSEGINLQNSFTAVLHYDLPWNPNRLEQREGRVDRFGQSAPEVRTCLLYGADNPIDGIVLDVLLRKVREIRKATGISVPFPDDSQSILDTITQALLLNPDRKIGRHRDNRQITFDFADFDEADAARADVTRKIEEAAEREKISRSIFAQNAIKADEIEADLREVDEALGDPRDVQHFVVRSLNDLFGAQVLEEGVKTPSAVRSGTRQSSGSTFRKGDHTGSSKAVIPAQAGIQSSTVDSRLRGNDEAGAERPSHTIQQAQSFRVITGNLPPQLRDLLPKGDQVRISFQSPTPPGCHYLGRNNRFVEQLCQMVMAATLARADRRAARAAVIRTNKVSIKTTLLLFRCRNVIEQQKGEHQIVAEEMLLWGWRGTPDQREFLGHADAKALLSTAQASSELSPEARTNFLTNELQLLDTLRDEFSRVAERQSQNLVDAHERFSALMDGKRFQIVYPVLPMDLLGVYVLLPG